jgi:hypothetical protein
VTQTQKKAEFPSNTLTSIHPDPRFQIHSSLPSPQNHGTTSKSSTHGPSDMGPRITSSPTIRTKAKVEKRRFKSNEQTKVSQIVFNGSQSTAVIKHDMAMKKRKRELEGPDPETLPPPSKRMLGRDTQRRAASWKDLAVEALTDKIINEPYTSGELSESDDKIKNDQSEAFAKLKDKSKKLKVGHTEVKVESDLSESDYTAAKLHNRQFRSVHLNTEKKTHPQDENYPLESIEQDMDMEDITSLDSHDSWWDFPLMTQDLLTSKDLDSRGARFICHHSGNSKFFWEKSYKSNPLWSVPDIYIYDRDSQPYLPTMPGSLGNIYSVNGPAQTRPDAVEKPLAYSGFNPNKKAKVGHKFALLVVKSEIDQKYKKFKTHLQEDYDNRGVYEYFGTYRVIRSQRMSNPDDLDELDLETTRELLKAWVANEADSSFQTEGMDWILDHNFLSLLRKVCGVYPSF